MCAPTHMEWPATFFSCQTGATTMTWAGDDQERFWWICMGSAPPSGSLLHQMCSPKEFPWFYFLSNLTSTRVIFKSTRSWMWYSCSFPPLMKTQSRLKLLLVCTNKAVMISVVSFTLHRPLHHSISFILRMKGTHFHFVIRFLCLLSWDRRDPESWFTHENLLFLVWLVACDMGCKTMVKLIKWFWWSGTATKRLVWLQMSLNVQQISKAIVEGKWLD